MRAEQQAAAKLDDFDPLVPFDVIRPPQQRGTDDVQLGVIPPLEPKEMPESEIEQKNHSDVPSTDQEQPPKGNEEGDFPDYKGDVNAPIEAEHPLANPPESQEELPPVKPRD